MKKAEKEMILLAIDEMMAIVRSGICEPDDPGVDVLKGMSSVFDLIIRWPVERGDEA